VGIARGDIACPVTTLQAWLEAAGISEGAVFRRVFTLDGRRWAVAFLGATMRV
jgi:hypothetical protein